MGEDVFEGVEEGQEVFLEYIYYLDFDIIYGGYLVRIGGLVIYFVISKF